MASKFTKGQTVYYASSNFSEVVDYKAMTRSIEYRVISRIVDSCGAKQMTFVNRGYDSVFGKKVRSSNPTYFATPAEAFAFLENDKRVEGMIQRELKVTITIYPDVVGDDVWVPSILSK